MLPARQRFDPAHLARRRIGFGLVVDDDLVALECAPQLSDERETSQRVMVVGGGIDDRRVRVLAHVHRDVGVPDQRLHVLSVVGVDRDSDAGLDLDREPTDDNRHCQLVAELVGDQPRRGAV